MPATGPMPTAVPIRLLSRRLAHDGRQQCVPMLPMALALVAGALADGGAAFVARPVQLAQTAAIKRESHEFRHPELW